jgi:hypothetical protein
MKDVIKRVRAEKEDLDLRLGKLNLFIIGEKFMDLEQELRNMLVLQSEHMRKYSISLRDRLMFMKKT